MSPNRGNPPPPPRDHRPDPSRRRALWQFGAVCLVVVGIVVAADLGWLTVFSKWVHSLPLGDKLVHAVAMGLVCGLADRAFPSRPLRPSVAWLRVTPLIVTLLVVGEEFSQRWIPGRNFDWGDLAADLLGIGLALWWRNNRLPVS